MTDGPDRSRGGIADALAAHCNSFTVVTRSAVPRGPQENGGFGSGPVSGSGRPIAVAPVGEWKVPSVMSEIKCRI